MPKLTRSAKELRSLILAEVASKQVCPPAIDVAVRPDSPYGWKADIISPTHVGYADCVNSISTIVRRLRREYNLSDY